MRLLLDTHIWLWSLLEPHQLNERILVELEDPRNELWLSPMSAWELMILVEKGRVVLDTEVVEWIGAALSRIPMMEAPVTHEVAIESRRVVLPHQDPVDRFLAATAKVLDLTLVTADARLLDATGFAVLANR